MIWESPFRRCLSFCTQMPETAFLPAFSKPSKPPKLCLFVNSVYSKRVHRKPCSWLRVYSVLTSKRWTWLLEKPFLQCQTPPHPFYARPCLILLPVTLGSFSYLPAYCWAALHSESKEREGTQRAQPIILGPCGWLPLLKSCPQIK